ncbi:CLAVATA3/ESR (CLE)-related protein 25-like [Amaranthus tricolor]|uniref:CLAVATA3/ESR (CLE)-related protein 25-like n=1 Tax=Amaranthus tricolor TaxID=29722 RepID=UPI0025875F2B|nr:CLAVATA3/ESR (CLE)-related protein 25-like [Amaranthus tricolor]
MSKGRFNKYSSKRLLRLITFVSFLWLFLFGLLANGDQTIPTIGRKIIPHSKVDMYYMSKRKVPNGPDPIHNRRAGNSRQPPGQA